MFDRVLLTLDGSVRTGGPCQSPTTWRLGLGAKLELLRVTTYPWDVQEARRELEIVLADQELRIVPTVTVRALSTSPAATIAHHAAFVPGTLIVMSTLGRGRTGAVLGSVTTDVLRLTHRPVVAVGGHASVDGITEHDALVIPVDGSTLSEAAVPLGAALAKAFRARPWVVTNIDPHTSPVAGALDGNYPRAIARRVTELAGREADFDALYERHAGPAVAAFAASVGAGLIVCSTHGRTGWGRLALGSVGAAIVHEAPCPVVLVRPPALEPLIAEQLTEAAATVSTPPSDG